MSEGYAAIFLGGLLTNSKTVQTRSRRKHSADTTAWNSADQAGINT